MVLSSIKVLQRPEVLRADHVLVSGRGKRPDGVCGSLRRSENCKEDGILFFGRSCLVVLLSEGFTIYRMEYVVVY